MREEKLNVVQVSRSYINLVSGPHEFMVGSDNYDEIKKAISMSRR